ncbi:hypothetical protein niasHT_000046 [Heterodera trifolii]|uniref:Protein kinase domain-containing protein n=1 Tax=Heterodera trifolii TaxID=157864 RepID=A0ABD2MDA8_9BILA
MYVKKVGEDETLKLIDYDGATFIPVGLFENPRKLANKVVPREFYVATPTYAAIEYYEDMLVSTKMDMWALGIIIYELILVQESFNERISVGKITQILLGIGNIYLGMQRNSKGEKQSDESCWDERATRRGTDEANGGGGRASEGLARGKRVAGEASESGGRASEGLARVKRVEEEEERAKDWREGSEWRVKRADAEEERAKDWREGSEWRVKRAERVKRVEEEEERATDWREGSEWRAKRAKRMKQSEGGG